MENFFPSNLKHLRTQSGMTQSDLASKLDKDYSTIGKWELGERNPSTLDLFKIADIFNVSERDLVSKNLIYDNNNDFNELELLFDKHKDILTESDKNIIKTIIEERKKKIDKELGDE
ncbi:MAG: helix-turn-helix domain-containing protein [Bacillota bacterium]|nr:helix-turn-helix domain-containing protein [Bacillota bacterium]